jgi:hypothetical protein
MFFNAGSEDVTARSWSIKWENVDSLVVVST